MQLNPDSTVPLYIQIKEFLRMQIETGAYGLGARLPSERELSHQYNVSRMTARQALQLLAQTGLVQSRVGKGTFVRQPRIDQELHELTGFSEEMRQRGLSVASRVLRAELLTANAEVAAQLQVAPGAEIVLLSRVRLANHQPLALEISQLNHRLCPNILERHDFSHTSLYHVLRADYGNQLAWANQIIQARLPDKQEVDALNLSTGDPVLSFTRVTFTRDDQPIEYARSVYRGDQYQLHSILRYTEPER